MTSEALAFQSAPIITFGYLMQVVLSLLVVLGLLYLVAKFVLPRLKLASAGRLIQVLDRVYLEPQVSAYILKVGRQAWLVVAGNKQVARIDQLDAADLPDKQP